MHLNGRRYFSIPFKLGQSGSAALPLPRVPPFLSVCTLFLYARISETVACINNLHTAYKSTTLTQNVGVVVLIKWLQSALIPFVATQNVGVLNPPHE